MNRTERHERVKSAVYDVFQKQQLTDKDFKVDLMRHYKQLMQVSLQDSFTTNAEPTMSCMKVMIEAATDIKPCRTLMNTYAYETSRLLAAAMAEQELIIAAAMVL